MEVLCNCQKAPCSLTGCEDLMQPVDHLVPQIICLYLLTQPRTERQIDVQKDELKQREQPNADDDLVLFAKANQANCIAIREVLDTFCEKSGQTISESKSRVFFSPNVDVESREDLCDLLGFRATSSLGKYLGIPIKHRGQSNQDFNFILDRMKQKLSGWKANLLSMAGRSVLIQSSLSTIPNYSMQCAYLPSKVLEGIDRISKNFLWGSTEASNKMHWVGWQKVTRPRKEGGLGLQSAKGRNTSLLAKLNWRFHSEKETLWARVLRSKYCSRRRTNSANCDKLPCSRVWKGMKKGHEVFTAGTKWVIGNDSNLEFWTDNWSSQGPIRNLVQGPLTREESNMKVKEVISGNGWNWGKISFDLPLSIKLGIQATPYAFAARSEDRMSWAANIHGNFDLKSAYNLATSRDVNPEFRGHWIWRIKILPRIQFFVWKCFHNSIGVKDCLASRGINPDPSCPRCHNGPETIIHLLRDCGGSKDIWKQLDISEEDRNFFSCDLDSWLSTNARNDQGCCPNKPPWNIVFLFAIWMIWMQRNKMIFQNSSPDPHLADRIISQASDFFWYAADWKKTSSFATKNIRWERPRIDWKKLNTDGSSLGNPGLAGGGGVIRDASGSWVVGFSRRIGVTSSFEAELWALRDGLNICVNKNFQAVEVELDAKAIIDVLQNPSQSCPIISPLLDDCKQLVTQIPHIQFSHCYREANCCADSLARMGVKQDEVFCLFENPPVELLSVFNHDLSGLTISRRCPTGFVPV